MQRLFDIKKTQIDLVLDRGYTIPQDEVILKGMKLHEFAAEINRIAAEQKTSARSALSRIYESVDATGAVNRRMLVYFAGKTDPLKTQVSVDAVRHFILSMQTHAVSEAIFIVDHDLSPPANKELKDVTTARWQVFNDSDLTYNPVRHVDVPKHELLKPSEARAKLAEMKVDLSKLPIIKISDPIVRYYGWPVGGIVRIYRHDRSVSILAPQTINYRVITN